MYSVRVNPTKTQGGFTYRSADLLGISKAVRTHIEWFDLGARNFGPGPVLNAIGA